MKNFRNNLHSVFFYPENFYPEEDLSAKKEEYYTSQEFLDKQRLEQEVKGEKAEVREDVIQHPEFLNVAGNVASDVSSRYTDMEQLKKDRRRFQERLKSKSDDGKGEEYAKVWEKKIKNGYDDLIKALEEKQHFDGLSNEKRAQEQAEILVKYSKEVHTQYEKYIWTAGDNTFDSVKDFIFGPNSKDYPANKIYTKLKGAASISKVDRQYTSGYNVSLLDTTKTTGETAPENEGNTPETDEQEVVETEINKKNRKFLSNDLPRYLWDIRKTPGILNVMKWLPIFSVKTDRPSDVDREAISDFIKAANRIPTKSGKLPEMVLMEALHDNLNTDSTIDDYVAVLEKHGMDKDVLINRGYKQFKKCISKVMEVGNFYIKTQRANNDVKDQHAIYLTVLGIIESEGGADKAVKKFQSIVEQGKKDKKSEKKEGFESGEKLGATNPELYEIAKNLGITDFTSATRLSEKDENYFKTTPVEKILANLNNDNSIDSRDVTEGGLKTGSQFLETFKQVGSQIGEEKALSNLVEHAKLVNKTLGVGLPDALFNPSTIGDDIKNGHTGLILLLQNVISKPGEDLYTLLLGHPENPFEGIDLATEEAAAKKYAAEMVSKMDTQALRSMGLQTPENIAAGLSTTLFNDYKKQIGVGVSGKISFDQWVKGLSMNTGVQVRDDGGVIIGIGIDYRRKIDLGKGWSTTPDVSAGAFIPLGYGDPELSGTAGFNEELAKERVTKNGTQAKLGLQTGITVSIPGWLPTISAGFIWERNKSAGIESTEQKKMVEFRDEIISPLLKDISLSLSSKGKTKLNFNDPEVVDLVKKDLRLSANKLINSDELKRFKIKTEKSEAIENAVNATMRLLLNYNNADLSQEGVQDLIAQGVADQYAMAWAEDRKIHITDKAYLSGANLGVFWVVGTKLVGVYAGIKITKHDLDGYGDRWGKAHEIAGEHISEWTEDELNNKINQQLGLSAQEQLKLVDGLVVIPASMKHRINVNPKMKGLMKKGENGEILLHPQTPMSIDIRRGAATHGSEINIGGNKLGEGESFVKLNIVGDDWFATENISEDEVLQLSEGINTYSIEALNQVLTSVKQNLLPGDPIQSFDFSMLTEEEQQELINKMNSIERTNKAKIVITHDSEGNLNIGDPVPGVEGKGIDIDYKANFDLIDQKAKDVADAVYAEALRIKDPKILNAVKHDKPKHRPQYDPFRDAMQEKNYEKARDALKPIFDKLITDYKLDKNNNGFTIALKTLDQLDGAALGQALMSINNIFARSTKVRGGGDNYEFKGFDDRGREVPVSMGSIIKEREGQILKSIENYKGENITSEVKAGYKSLIDASAKYREKTKVFDKKMSSSALDLKNTVGFNLGDKTNPENPLFNPEIYNPGVDINALSEYGFDENAKNTLHERAMRLFAGNEALINPILKLLDAEGQKVEIKEFIPDGEKGKLTLDIGGKIIKLNAGMKFGYFTQCVNHTVILDGISIETQDGAHLDFASNVWNGERVTEGTKSSNNGGWTVSAGIHFIFKKEKPEEQPENTPVGSDRADNGGKKFHTDDGGKQDEEIPPVDDKIDIKDTGGEEV